MSETKSLLQCSFGINKPVNDYIFSQGYFVKTLKKRNKHHKTMQDLYMHCWICLTSRPNSTMDDVTLGWLIIELVDWFVCQVHTTLARFPPHFDLYSRTSTPVCTCSNHIQFTPQSIARNLWTANGTGQRARLMNVFVDTSTMVQIKHIYCPVIPPN